jgi:hypothetical protein
MAQCTLTFTMCPKTYSSNEKKVLFVVSLLRGTALDWARGVAEDEHHPLRNNYPAFKEALSNLYLDRNYKALCETKLLRLKQTKSAAAYAVEFESLVSVLNLDNDAKCLLFYEHLHPDVKDAIATVGRATTFTALVDQAVSIDQRKFQRRMENKKLDSSPQSSAPKSTPPARGSNPPNKPSGNPNSNSNANINTNQPRTPLSKPRDPLTDSEKLHRKQNKLCAYCGDPSHDISSCPRLRAKEAKANAISFVPLYPQNPTPRTAPNVRPVNSENSNAQAPTRSEA